MRGKTILAISASLLLASVVLVQAEEKAKAAPKKAASRAVIWPAADIKWVDLSADAPGVKIADLWGDHTKGAYGALMKFPAGFAAPLHTHTHDISIVVVSGTFIHTPEGKPEVRLGPGSYLKQPGDGYRHMTACDKASECVFFTESKGAFDLHPVEAAKPDEKK
jgi:quercetin dioxygenase-like cupin family protein